MEISKEMRYAMIRRASNKIQKKAKMRKAAYNLMKRVDKIVEKENQS